MADEIKEQSPSTEVFVTGTCTEEEAKQPIPEGKVTAATTEEPKAAEPTKPIMSEKDIKSFEEAKNGLLNSIKDMVPPGLLQKEKLTDADKDQIKNSVASYLEQQYLKRYYLDKLDLEEEYEKIKVKHSGLSRSQRDAVVGYFLIFKWGPIVQQKIQDLKMKEKRTQEEEELLQTILGTTDLSEAYKAVVNAEPTDTTSKPPVPPPESTPVAETKEPVNE